MEEKKTVDLIDLRSTSSVDGVANSSIQASTEISISDASASSQGSEKPAQSRHNLSCSQQGSL